LEVQGELCLVVLLKMMTTTRDSEILVWALPFDGTQEKFPVWRDKFEAIAQAKGYRWLWKMTLICQQVLIRF
jgi:hypothetical protein